MIKLEEDKEFLINHRKKDSPGFICGINAKLSQQKKGLFNDRNRL